MDNAALYTLRKKFECRSLAQGEKKNRNVHRTIDKLSYNTIHNDLFYRQSHSDHIMNTIPT